MHLFLIDAILNDELAMTNQIVTVTKKNINEEARYEKRKSLKDFNEMGRCE